jgi:hypothetical protein
MEEPVDRATSIKNLSIKLLQSDTPQGVLDIFEKEYLSPGGSAAEMISHEDLNEKYVENLIMLLLFFKTKAESSPTDQMQKLVADDYRAKALLAMTMEAYSDAEDIGFAYQVSAVYSVAMLS